jgi:hypothetical protein
MAAVPSTGDSAEQASSQAGEVKAYFLHIDGRALPLKQVLVNGTNVLGGSVISLSLPLNISGYTKAGLNTLQIEYISDPKSNLTVVVEKRTPGPKTEEIAKLAIAADDSKTAVKSTVVSFNLPADGGVASVGELKDVDKAAISEQFEHYYKALCSAKADQVRALYRQSLADERKLSPESARFFENVIAREVAILKNKDLRLEAFNQEGLVFKVEGDIVKLYRQDSKPLVESNEVDARIDPLMIEVGQDKPTAGKKAGPKARALKANKDKVIEIPSSEFKPEAKASESKMAEVKTGDGTVIAKEITIEDSGPVFDGASSAKTDNAEAFKSPVKTAVKERLVRFNLYFKPSKPDSAGKRVWIISLPPNV